MHLASQERTEAVHIPIVIAFFGKSREEEFTIPSSTLPASNIAFAGSLPRAENLQETTPSAMVKDPGLRLPHPLPEVCESRYRTPIQPKTCEKAA
jgi:hypothetical protein